MIVWAIAVLVLPHSTAYAEEAAPRTPAPVMENAPSNVAPAPADHPGGMLLDAKPAGLVYRLDARDSALASEEFRFDFAHRPPPPTGIRLTPALSAARSGWAISGRAGPVRWLTPLDGESGTTMRLGGRVADQPRTPGLGLFNMSLHYRFE